MTKEMIIISPEMLEEVRTSGEISAGKIAKKFNIPDGRCLGIIANLLHADDIEILMVPGCPACELESYPESTSTLHEYSTFECPSCGYEASLFDVLTFDHIVINKSLMKRNMMCLYPDGTRQEDLSWAVDNLESLTRRAYGPDATLAIEVKDKKFQVFIDISGIDEVETARCKKTLEKIAWSHPQINLYRSLTFAIAYGAALIESGKLQFPYSLDTSSLFRGDQARKRKIERARMKLERYLSSGLVEKKVSDSQKKA